MKIRKEYMVKYVEGVPYLLPYGQGIAQKFLGMKLMEEEVFLWEQIQSGCDEAACVLKLSKDRGLSEEEAGGITADFFQHLEQLEIISRKKRHLIGPLEDHDVFEIAGLAVMYNGPQEYIPEELELYRMDNAMQPVNLDEYMAGNCPLQRLEVVLSLPRIFGIGEMLIRSRELMVYADDRHYYYLFPYNNCVHEMRVRKDGSKAVIFIPDCGCDEAVVQKEVYEAMHHSYLILAMAHGKFAFSSLSLQYQELGYLFIDAPQDDWAVLSERLSHMENVVRCNHRTNLVEISGSDVLLWNIPWGHYEDSNVKEPLKLGGVISLCQDTTNFLETIDPGDMVIYIARGMVSPKYSRDLTVENIDFSAKVCNRVKTWRMHCNQEPEALAFVQQTVDAHLVH